MKKNKRILVSVMIFLLLFLNINTTVSANANEKSSNTANEPDEWHFSAFGSNTSGDKNPDPVIGDNEVTLQATGGKISSSADGISFYHEKLPANANFEINATATVKRFGDDNQASFGLMLRDQIGAHLDTEGHVADYIAVGALDKEIKGFYKHGNQEKLSTFDESIPSAYDVYDLKIKKSGNSYVVSIDGNVSEPIILDDLFTDEVFAGVYAARDAEVSFSNLAVHLDSNEAETLAVDASHMKTAYLIDEPLETEGLEVSAVFSDGTSKRLSPDDYIITGFDSSKPGQNVITINYNGLTALIELEISDVTITHLEIEYYPAKTAYFKGDAFDPEGLAVTGVYNDGYQTKELSEDQYSILIDDLDITEEEYIFAEAGTIPVTIMADEATATFHVEVRDAEMSRLEIKQLPKKINYFIGEELDLAGISVIAVYSDGSEVNLTDGDYAVSDFDASTTGEKEITLSYKGQKTSLNVIVKDKEFKEIQVTRYPQTTYNIGDDFNEEGLEVSKVYDNGEKTPLSGDEYHIETADFDNNVPGVYAIQVVPQDATIKPITFNVTVREAHKPEWKEIRFGQSISKDKNYIEKVDEDTIKVVAEEGGGKITGDHDGITFYYTEIDAEADNFVLSADIHVETYAKEPHDGQESFGIMARDAIGKADDPSVFASNMMAIGGFSGGTGEDNGTQLFGRTGVLASDGEGSEGIQKVMLDGKKPDPNNTAENYKLTLAKTNSGYTGKLNNGNEETFYEPEILNVQDGRIYVGFYAARLANIDVSNMELKVTDAETDPPQVVPPEEPISPELDILSRDKTSKTDYDLILKSNVDGIVHVKQDQTAISERTVVKAGGSVEIPTTLTKNGNTKFSIEFLPDDTQDLTDYAKIIRNYTVTMKTFAEDGDIYVSPSGKNTGNGTKESPLDLDTAIDFVQEGQRIIVLEGHYKRATSLEIEKYNDGREDAIKSFIADPDANERPVIDFQKKSVGVVHSGNYWHIKGIDFTRSAGNTKGYTVGGSHNTIENVSVYENGDTGLQISRTDETETDKSKWPSYNLILNSISFDNRDPSENNADGFAAKLTVGEGNVFRGSVSHNNIDDGWDLYTKVGTGAIGAVTIENCISFNNGTLTNGYQGHSGQNGFKLGGEGVHVSHQVKNNVAYGNGTFGFTSNSNPGITAEDNIGFDNDDANLSFTTYNHITEDFTIDGFASIRTEGKTKDSYPSRLKSDKNYMFNGSKSVNASELELSDSIPASLEKVFDYNADGKVVSVKRDAAGNIQWGNLWDTFNDEIHLDGELDLPELEALIKTAKSYLNKVGTYTEGSLVILKQAIESAEASLGKVDSEVMLKDLLKDLHVAIDGLVPIDANPKVDLSEFTALIKTAKSYLNDKGSYTKASLVALAKAIESAEASLDKIDSDELLNEEVKALQTAINGLVPIAPDQGVDVSELEALIEAAKSYLSDQDTYTKAALAELKEAVKLAEASLGKIDSEAMLKEEQAALRGAIDTLKKNDPALQTGEQHLGEEDNSKGMLLPNTATSMYTMLGVGFILVIMGFIILITIHRRRIEQ